MEIIEHIFGEGPELFWYQMGARAVLIFFIALVLIRYTGMRVFGIQSALDICIMIMLGSVLSRSITGNAPLLPTIFAAIVLILIHRIIAGLSVNNPRISHLVKGIQYSLYKNGQFNQKNLRRCALSKGDVMEEVRLHLKEESLENVKEIFMERTGKISIIKMKPEE